jgi:hypothetical protein
VVLSDRKLWKGINRLFFSFEPGDQYISFDQNPPLEICTKGIRAENLQKLQPVVSKSMLESGSVWPARGCARQDSGKFAYPTCKKKGKTTLLLPPAYD